jgi:septum formation topological specificity factor MinE
VLSGFRLYHVSLENMPLERQAIDEPILITERCYGAASAKKRLDVVIRDAINAGDIPGPRYLANGQEIARRDGELVGGITAFADGPDEMRKVINEHVEIGVDNIKLSMSGEEVSVILWTLKAFAAHTDWPFPDHRDSISA